MKHQFLAFDIETAKDIPGEDFNWKPHRPLGITCIASQPTGSDEPRVWFSRDSSGAPARQMSQADVASFVHQLVSAARDGFVPLSWNGLSFDFDILAEESGLVGECKKLALTHVDMMFHVVCKKGFRVALNNAAAGLGLPGKLDGVAGIDAPGLWAAGKHDVVCEYVKQDVRTTLAVACESEKRRSFAWKTRKGTVSSMPLPRGWLAVDAAAKLPLPDTSWVSNPPMRRDFMAWVSDD